MNHNLRELLEKQSKEVLIRIIELRCYGITPDVILSFQWEVLSRQSLALMDKSIRMSKGKHYYDPEYQAAGKLWEQSMALEKKASLVYLEMESIRKQSSQPTDGGENG